MSKLESSLYFFSAVVWHQGNVIARIDGTLQVGPLSTTEDAGELIRRIKDNIISEMGASWQSYYLINLTALNKL